MNKYGIFSIVLLGSMFTCSKGNFTCHSCYYSVEHSEVWSKTECMTDPAKSGVSLTVPCRESYFCDLQEIYDIVKLEVVEFSRSCKAEQYATGCTKDTYHVVCRKSCKGNLCNINETANLHELYYSGLVG